MDYSEPKPKLSWGYVCPKRKKPAHCWQELSPLPSSPSLALLDWLLTGWSESMEPKILSSMGNALQDLGWISRSSELALGSLTGCRGQWERNVVTTHHHWAVAERANSMPGTTAGISSLSHEAQKEISMQKSLFKRLQTTPYLSPASSRLWWVTLIGKHWYASFSKPTMFWVLASVVLNMFSFATLHPTWLPVSSSATNGCWLVHIPVCACRQVKQACFLRLHIS